MRLRALATTADTSTTADGEDWPTSDTTPKDIKPTKSRRRKSSVKRSRPKLRRKTISAGSSSASSPFEQYAATDTERSEVADSTEHETTDDDTRSPVEASNKDTTIPAQPLLVEQPAQKRWRDWWIRCIWTMIMVGAASFVVLSGQLWVILMILLFQTLIFKEVIAIAHVPSKEKKLPWFRLINWYFLLVTNYFLYGETLFSHFRENVLVDAFFHPFASHHRFSSFILYVIGLVFFVMNLKKGHYKFQFLQFFWTHMTLLVVVFQSHFIISNTLEGLIWFVLPVSLVVVNDVFAYVGGFFLGRTRLIALSPKKTWEGFIVGFLCTLIFAGFATGFMVKLPYLVCPMKDLTLSAWDSISCERNPVFIPVRYKLSPALVSFSRHFLRRELFYVSIAPLQWHAMIMAGFASSIAPFGGFFASGFKRAFKLKDFGDSIPGHGGFTDRMDCQLLMGMFSHMYYTTFIKTYEAVSVSGLLQMAVDGLSPEEQLHLYEDLRSYLIGQALLAQ